MKKQKKYIAFMLAVLIGVFEILSVMGSGNTVLAEEVDENSIVTDENVIVSDEASSLPIVNEAQVTERIMDLAKKLKINDGNLNVGSGIQFTVTQGACGHATNNAIASGCTNCKNANVMQSAWFKSTFGYTVDVSLLPGHYAPTGSITSSAWTCAGFANFALWYIAKDSSTSDVYRDLLGTQGQAFTKENLQNSGIRIGDVIRVNGHSVMFLSYEANNTIKVLDCNWVSGVVANIAMVKIHTMSLNASYPMAITRARNYQPDADTIPPVISDVQLVKDSAGYTISCVATDNVGVAKVAFPTWTVYNGQDDLAANWDNTQLGTYVDGRYVFRVNDYDHYLERGLYDTHIYAYDTSGNYSLYEYNFIDLQNTFNPVAQIIYKNSKYLVYDDLLTWDEAKAKCEAMGGHLATITSQGEQDTIAGLINGREIYRRGYYLGGTLTNKQLSWITGEKVTYTNWTDGQPDNAQGKEPVLEIFSYLKQWNDAVVGGCSLGFICEIELPIKLSANNVSLSVDNTQALKLTNTESKLTVNDITWTSSNTNVATVSNGTITAKNPGTATITAKYGTKSATCTVTVTPKPVSTQIKAFVERLYTLALGRPADPAGIEDWSNKLASKKTTGAEIGYGFIFSSEFESKNLSNEEIVEIMYNTFLGRASDASGKKYWVDAMNAGVDVEKVFHGFVMSDEFKKICTDSGIEQGTVDGMYRMDKINHYKNIQPNITAFVGRCYFNVLQRAPETEGVENWCRIIITKQITPQVAAKSFFQSDEYIAKATSNGDYVRHLYTTFLGRECDADGYNTWVGLLDSGAYTRDAVLEGFARSDEFAGILAGFGLN